jgi:hypothetical protein
VAEKFLVNCLKKLKRQTLYAFFLDESCVGCCRLHRLCNSQERANKACSGFVGFCGIFKHFSGFGFFLLSGIFPARPQTTNANR